MRFQILGSSSSGNCGLLITDECKVLVDAGFSARRLKPMLEAAGETFESIDGVFLTHEHQDHSAALRGLGKYQHLRYFANRDTANFLQQRLTRRLNWQVFETGRDFAFRDLRVSPFSVPHDAHDPVGFLFEAGGGSLFSPQTRLAWVTDLGYVPQLVREKVREADVLVIEANHDAEMLDTDVRRPWSVKQRIRGRHGHLSNDATFELLETEARARWSQIFLGHLSRDCNTIEKVRERFDPLGSRFAIEVLDPEGCASTPAYECGITL